MSPNDLTTIIENEGAENGADICLGESHEKICKLVESLSEDQFAAKLAKNTRGNSKN